MIQDTVHELIDRLIKPPQTLTYPDFRRLHELIDLLQYQVNTIERVGWKASEQPGEAPRCGAEGCEERNAVNWAAFGHAPMWRCAKHAPRLPPGKSPPAGIVPPIDLKEAQNMLRRWEHYVKGLEAQLAS